MYCTSECFCEQIYQVQIFLLDSRGSYISSSELPYTNEQTKFILTMSAGQRAVCQKGTRPHCIYFSIHNFPSQLGHAPWLFFAPEFPENDDNIWYKKNGKFF